MSVRVTSPGNAGISTASHASAARGVSSVTLVRAVFVLAFVLVPLLSYGFVLAKLEVAAAWCSDASVYAALGILTWRLARATRAEVAEGGAAFPRGRALVREYGAVVALFALATFFGFRGFLAAHGVPAFRQDWAWPADDDEMHAFWSFITSDWTPAAMGHTKPYPTLYVMFAPLVLLGRVLHPKDVLALFFGFCELAAGVGMYALCRTFFGTRIVAALAAALLFASAPFVVDKTVGGHIHVLLAYALLPWTILVQIATDRATRVTLAAWIAVQAALLAAAMSALTFVAFDAVAMLCVALVLRRRRRAVAVTALCVLLAFACNAQSLYHLGGNSGLDSGRAAIDWLRYLSVDSARVLSLLSYLPGYARDAMPDWIPAPAVAALAPVSLALVGWAATFASARAVVFALIAVLGIVGTTGVIGPFAPLKELAYGNVRALAAFREFYNMQSLEMFGLAGAFAAAIHAALTRPRYRIAAATAAAAFIAVACAPFLSGGLVPQMPYFAESQAYRDFARRLTPSGGERIAMFPIVQPIRRGHVPFAGVDVFPNGFRGHPTLAEWHSEPSVALAALEYERGDVVRANRIFDLLGVKWLLLRDGLTSALPSFWYPSLFPPGWETNGYYRDIAASRDLTPRGTNVDFALLENPHAIPIVALAPARRACDGTPLLVIADGACPRFGADPLDAPAGVVRLPLPPDHNAIDPGAAWTTPGAIFSKGPVYAAATSGVGTVSGAPYALHFTAGAGKIYLRCASDAGVRAYLNGTALGTLCRTRPGEPPRWFGGAPTRAGANSFVAVNAGGASILTDAVVDLGVARGILAPLSTFWWAPPFEPPYQRAHVRFARPSATNVRGDYASAVPATLVFSDDFDRGWTASIDGGPPQASRTVNGIENGFDVPAGRHRFVIDFGVSRIDRALGLVQGWLWPIFGATIGATLVSRLGRRTAA